MDEFEIVGGNLPPSPAALEGRSSSIAGATRLLDRLSRETGLTSAGRNWVVAACDPFHDTALEVDGYPDYQTGNSIVQVVKRTMTVTTPDPTVKSWDCNIFTTPLMVDEVRPRQRRMKSFILGNDQLGSVLPSAGSGTENPFGTVVAVSAPVGARTFPSGTTGVTVLGSLAPKWQAMSVSKTDNASPPLVEDNYTAGKTRLLGCAFEVVNTTAVLNQQGAVMPYNVNRFSTESTCMTTDILFGPLNTYRQCTSQMSRGPPGVISEAALLPDSRQWHAGEGVYSVSRMQGEENEYTQAVSSQPLFFGNDTSAYSPQPATLLDAPYQIVPEGSIGDTLPGVNDGIPQPRQYHKFDMNGAYFTGLSSETSLVVNARFIIERAPTTSESDLILLARPSPAADPIAFAIYSEAVRLMPPGVKLAENALGGWFKQAVGNVMNEVLPAVPKLIAGYARGGPLGAALAGTEHAVGRIAPRTTKREREAISRDVVAGANRARAQLTRTNSTREERRRFNEEATRMKRERQNQVIRDIGARRARSRL